MEDRGVFDRVAKMARAFIAVVSAVAVLWLVVYRLVLGFTPPWLDLVTIVSGGLGALVLWKLGSGSQAGGKN
jgi:uncharacterized membrane protein (DUF485 family)